MVTYSDLFQFCLVVIGICGLFIQVYKSKKVTALSSPARRLLLRNHRGLTVCRQRPFYFQYNRLL